MYFLHFCSYILHEKCRGISSINESYRTLILSMLGILDLSGNKSKVYGQAIMKPFCISTERNFLSIDCTFCKFVTWPREIYFTKWWNSLNYHLLLQMNCFLFFSSSDSTVLGDQMEEYDIYKFCPDYCVVYILTQLLPY